MGSQWRPRSLCARADSATLPPLAPAPATHNPLRAPYKVPAAASTVAVLGSMWTGQVMLALRLQARIDGTILLATLITPTITAVTASLTTGTFISDTTHCTLVPNSDTTHCALVPNSDTMHCALVPNSDTTHCALVLNSVLSGADGGLNHVGQRDDLHERVPPGDGRRR
jgi:hypothetical protein